MGLCAEEWNSAKELQCQSGIAPVTKQSGRIHIVHRRYQCSTFWKQTFVEFAAQSVRFSEWAKVYYTHQIQKGKNRHAILRSLAYKWQRILFRCWKNGTLYDEKSYLEALKKSGSPIAEILFNQKEIKCA